ncbi:MAG: hypothetical protein HOH05_00530 [Marinovum sp.]|nr:hypothetical protein [Marinovum sp.]
MAKEFAERWYLDLKHRQIRGESISENSFGQAAERFMKEYEVMTGGTRNKDHVRGQNARITNHLLPYFGKMALSNVTTASVQDYRCQRRRKSLPMGRSKRRPVWGCALERVALK